jgi:hypothetical protein
LSFFFVEPHGLPLFFADPLDITIWGAAAAIYTLWPEMWYNESMKKFCIIAAVLVQAAAATSQTVNLGSIWAMPNIWPRHRQLRAEFMAAIHRGDISAMESTCRAAVHIMPNDAT